MIKLPANIAQKHEKDNIAENIYHKNSAWFLKIDRTLL